MFAAGLALKHSEYAFSMAARPMNAGLGVLGVHRGDSLGVALIEGDGERGGGLGDGLAIGVVAGRNRGRWSGRLSRKFSLRDQENSGDYPGDDGSRSEKDAVLHGVSSMVSRLEQRPRKAKDDGEPKQCRGRAFHLGLDDFL
jgi:hypothetical protein